MGKYFLGWLLGVPVIVLGPVNTYFTPATATDFIQHEA